MAYNPADHQTYGLKPIATKDLKYSSEQERLLAPFPEDEISSNYDGYPYIDPARIKRRIFSVYPNYSFEVHGVTVGTTAVTGYGTLYLDLDTGITKPRHITCFVMHEFQLNASTKEPQFKDMAVTILESELWKAIGFSLGVGMQIRDKVAKKGSSGGNTTAPTVAPVASAGAPASGTTSSDPHFDPNWSGTDAFGMNVKAKDGSSLKGTPYANLEDSLITWLCNKQNQEKTAPQPDPKALKERARRNAKAVDNITSQVANSTYSDDEEIPF